MVFSHLQTDDPILRVWEELLATQLVGVAEFCHAHGELYVDGDGRCFGQSCVHDAFYFEGASFAEAAERLLLGRQPRPMLRPDQQSVDVCGIRYTADYPEVHRYK